MPETNPYTPPRVAPAEGSDRILIRNFNQAGAPLAIALLIGPLALAGMIWAVTTGRFSDSGEIGPAAGIALIVLGCLAELAAIAYALTVPVLWVEIGPSLRHGSLIGAYEVDWNDVQRIWVDRDDTQIRVLPFLWFNVATHWMLVIRINDYKDLQVHVPTARMGLIEAIMRRHPRFKDSPFDDEPPDGPGGDGDV